MSDEWGLCNMEGDVHAGRGLVHAGKGLCILGEEWPVQYGRRPLGIHF